MVFFAGGFLLGCLLLQQFAGLPPWWLLLPLFLLAGLLSRWRFGPFPAGLAAGFAWAGLYALLTVPPTIPDLQPRQVYRARGVIVGLPAQRGPATRVRLRVDRLQRQGKAQSGDWLLYLSWYRAPRLGVGQRWELPLRIRPVHGLTNPGSWDSAGWLYRQGVRYRASLVRGEVRLLGLTDCCVLQRVRQWLRRRLMLLPAGQPRAVLLALVLGDRSALSTQLRNSLSATGGSHLLAISGLHIGLAAGVFGWLGARLWRRLPRLCGRVPARLVGALAGLLVAGAYAALSGMGLPAQRALVMLTVGLLVLLARRRVAPAYALAVALLAVLLFSPDAVNAAGFWLSFGAVGAIAAVLPLLQGRHWLAQAALLQLAVTLALYPLLLAFGLSSSPLAPLLNLFLVPLFGVLLVPAALFGTALLALSPALAGWLQPLLWALGVVIDVLQWLAVRAWQAPTVPWNWLRWCLLSLGVLLLWPGSPWRATGLALLLLAHLQAPPTLPAGAFRLSLLDVGQGLSAVVETRGHVLVYDTGAAYPSGFNLADAVVLPYLRQAGHARVDRLILSHADNDHSGAAGRLLAAVPVDDLLWGEPVPGIESGRRCHAGQSWEWDGVRFSLHWPPTGRGESGNNASCVLLVENAAGRLLLSGDIEWSAERHLVGELRAMAPVDVVVAGHHGSRTSSSADWVKAARAGWVLYSAGYLNRYRFPSPAVVQRWTGAGARSANTASAGMLGFEFMADGHLRGPKSHATVDRRYWRLGARGNECGSAGAGC